MININTAISQLCEIPGITEELAIKIIEERQSKGAFKGADDLAARLPEIASVLQHDFSYIQFTPVKKIDINSAVEELTQLPGVDAELALKIIEYRSNEGPFGKVEDINKVDSEEIRRNFSNLIPLMEAGAHKWYQKLSWPSKFELLTQITTLLAFFVTLIIGIATYQSLTLEIQDKQRQIAQLSGISLSGQRASAEINFPNVSREDSVVILNSPDDFKIAHFISLITNTRPEGSIESIQINVSGLSIVSDQTELPLNGNNAPPIFRVLDELNLRPGETEQVDLTQEIYQFLEVVINNQNLISEEAVSINLLVSIDVSLVGDRYFDRNVNYRRIEIRVKPQTIIDAVDIIDNYQNVESIIISTSVPE